MHIISVYQGSVAEWSKALVLGTSPQGRGFESHRYQTFYPPYLSEKEKEDYQEN
jgi:hypothetical protein